MDGIDLLRWIWHHWAAITAAVITLVAIVKGYTVFVDAVRKSMEVVKLRRELSHKEKEEPLVKPATNEEVRRYDRKVNELMDAVRRGAPWALLWLLAAALLAWYFTMEEPPTRGTF